MSGGASRSALADVVRRFRDHAGRRAKASIGLVAEALGPTDWLRGPGDDAAVVGEGSDGFTLAAGEAIWQPFVEADPRGAGTAAVVANVNDIAAMGGRALGLVDTIVGPERIARPVLEGMRYAADLYRVPVVGGHLTVRDGPPALSAFIVGRAVKILASSNARPGLVVLVAASIDGSLHRDFPFFSSLRERADHLAGDVEVLPSLAEQGWCLAAKDVSMAGLLGSLAMLLEPTRSGIVADIAAIPRPADVPIATWMDVFPSFGFVLCAPEDHVDDCRDAFTERGLACEAIGVLDGSGQLRAGLEDEEALLLDIAREGVTGLGDVDGRAGT
ncbi:MAG: AIR synthase related protein [Actinomycetota bacterium]